MRLNIFGLGKSQAQSSAAATGEFPTLNGDIPEPKQSASRRRPGAAPAKLPAAKSRVASGKSHAAPLTTDTLKKRVKWLLAQLDLHRERIEPALESGDTQAFIAAMEAYQAFTAAYTDMVAYDAFEIGPAFAEYQKFFSHATLEFCWRMEEQAFDEMLEASVHPGGRLKSVISQCVRGAYRRMEELPSLVDFKQFRSLCILGIGKVPSCLFYLQDETFIPAVVGIEKDHEAVECSNALVSKFNLDRVRVIEADAVNVDYSYFDAIYFDAFAAPRMEVLKRIRATGKPGATIILRDPIAMGSLGLEKVLPFVEPAFALMKSGDPQKYRGRFMLRHYVLKLR